MDFQSSLVETLEGSEQVTGFIDSAVEKLRSIDSKKVLSTEFLEDMKTELRKDFSGTVKDMENRLLDFLRKNNNHLQSYFLPEPEALTSGA